MSAFAHHGDKLRLREFVAADAAEVQGLHADPRVRALLPDAQPLHELRWAEAFTACLADFYRRHPGLGIWRCAVPVDGGESFAGWFSLMPVPARPGTAELGSRLLPGQWGSGLALAGGEVLLRHAFGTLALPTVWGICHPDNHSARACLEALGFTPHGRDLYEGQLSDFHALDASTWSTVQSLSHRERLRRARRLIPS
jgi:RimJ/RimL family protein N-acetyltransferase